MSPLDYGGRTGKESYYNVMAFGAKGDGVTDDTAAINAAFTALPSGSGATLVFPAGTYVCSTVTSGNVLLLLNKSFVHVLGVGPAQILFKNVTATDGWRIEGCGYSTFENLYLTVSGTTNITNVVHYTTASPGSVHNSHFNRVLVIGGNAAWGNSRCYYDVQTVSGSAVITSAQAAFSAGDIGCSVIVRQVAGGGPVISTISSVASLTGTVANGGTVTASQTSLPLSAPISGAPNSGYAIKVDSEYMLVTAGFQTATLTVQRGYNNSPVFPAPAATHADGSTVRTYQATLGQTFTNGNPNPISGPAWMMAQTAGSAVAVNAFAVGTDHPGASNLDIAQTTFYSCMGQNMLGAGFKFGNGTSGNILDIGCTNCTIDQNGVGVWFNGGGGSWIGGWGGENGVDFLETAQVTEPVLVTGMRSENSAMLWETFLGSAGFQQFTFRDIAFNNIMAGDGIPIRHSSGGALSLYNLTLARNVVGSNVTFYVLGANNDSQCHLTAMNIVTDGTGSPWPAAGPYLQRTIFGGGRVTPGAGVQVLGGNTWGNIVDGPMAGIGAPWYDVKAFGAKGDSTTDDTTAIQAAIDAVSLTVGGVVYFPPGTYKVSATLSQTGGFNCTLRGAGKNASIIAPTTALAGLPVIKFIDHRDATVETINVRGTPSGSVAAAAIQSTRHTALAGGLTGTHLTVKSCLLGSPIANGIATGVKWTADSTALDANNDASLMLDVEIEDFTVAAYSIGHANSLWHRIIGGNIWGGPTAVQLFGGSFDMQGTAITVTPGPAFDFQAPVGAGTPAYYHKSSIRGLAENASTILKATTTATTLDVDMIGLDWKTAPVPLATTIAAGSNGAILPQGSISVAANSLPASGEVVILTTTGNQRVAYTGGGGTTTLTGCTGGTGTMSTGNSVTQTILMIDFQAPGRVSIIGSDFNLGQPGLVAQFTDATSVVEMIGNTRLGFQVISYNGVLRMISNKHDPGVVTLNDLGSGVKLRLGESGGGFSAGDMDLQGSIIISKDFRRSRQTPTETVLVSGVDATLGENIAVTLTAARVVGAPLNPAIGQRLKFTFIQGGVGAFAVTWNAVFKKTWVDTGNATAARSSIAFDYDGTNWNQDGAQAPYV